MLVIELLNLINVVGNIFFLDAFLGGEFSAYGIEVCSTEVRKKEDRFISLF